MKRFGLTGGIASGKSTVSSMFRQAGVLVLDADEIAREVVAPGEPALHEIAQRFPGVVDADGQLDRAALGAWIFGHEAERAALNAITHPRIAQRVLERTQEAEARGAPLLIYDAPLLIENRLHEAMDGVVLVAVSPEVQLARLKARNGLDDAQARARVAAQLPLEDKRRHATWIIDNDGTLEETRRQVDAVLAAMRAMT